MGASRLQEQVPAFLFAFALGNANRSVGMDACMRCPHSGKKPAMIDARVHGVWPGGFFVPLTETSVIVAF